MKIYRTCRRAGVTPRGLIDCMIAAVAMRNNAELLAYDGDFVKLATIVSLRLDPATPAG
jgi:predicted nucleic acid-binding protein